MEKLLRWVDWEIQMAEEALEKEFESRHFHRIIDNNRQKLLLIKEYLNDYEKMANDYRDMASENRLLKLEKMELEGRYIYEDMRMNYRANRRKWGVRLWR